MSYRSGIWALAMLSACAQAGTSIEQHPDASGGGGGGADASIDAPSHVGGDASVDSPPGPCTNMTVNLLTNANFETTPLATGWTETRYMNEPIVRTDGTVAAQSPTTKAWLGGVVGDIGAAATDALTQDIVVPAGATNIVVTGFYEVRTSETGTSVYDRGSLDIVSTGGAGIEGIQSFDNAHATTAWTAITHPVTASIAGQTVRLKMSSSNDFLNATNFFFDTLAVTATVCQ